MHIEYPISLIAFDGTVTLIKNEAEALKIKIGWRGIDIQESHYCYYLKQVGTSYEYETYIAYDSFIARDLFGNVITAKDWPEAPYKRKMRKYQDTRHAMELGISMPYISCWKKGRSNNKKRHVGENRSQENHKQQIREATGNKTVRRARAKVDWDRNYRHTERNWKSQRKTQWK